MIRSRRFAPLSRLWRDSRCLLVGMLFTAGLAQAAPALPQHAPDKHLGVATCAGSTCHGAKQPFKNSPVLQNEFITWHKKDDHSKAYKVLLEDDSKRIAKNLGLKSAETAKECLDCHADNIPKDARGKRFQISDGVSCEACHGGAERWLGIHIVGTEGHEKNVENGLYPTEDPEARARLCLSCHFGTKNKFATHRIMGAGHPRISFELDTFTAIQPAHYKVDKDYRERKKVWSAVQTWAIGQAFAVEDYLDALIDPKRHRSGLFPELSLFDCQACHHKMEDKRWQPHKENPNGPGVVRLNDANLLMLHEIIKQSDPKLADEYWRGLVQLHKSTTESMAKVVQVANELRATTLKVRGQIAKHRFSASEVKAMLGRLAANGASGLYLDYSDAEQAYMAMDSLLATLESGSAVSDQQLEALQTALDGVYATLEKDEEFAPSKFITSAKALQAKLGN